MKCLCAAVITVLAAIGASYGWRELELIVLTSEL